jgi:hypothetical protein
MIKRQYHLLTSDYFYNFFQTVRGNHFDEELKKYSATLGKSKDARKINVKWHDPKLYTVFVLKWS